MESDGKSKRTICSKTISKKKSSNPRETLLTAQEKALILKVDFHITSHSKAFETAKTCGISTRNVFNFRKKSGAKSAEETKTAAFGNKIT